MKVAGGVIALIAGIFGCIAAVVTLFFGGVASVASAHGADTVIGLGWGGLVFSFLVIILGAIVIGSKSRLAGYLLIAASIGGAILGGTLVAVCMVLALIGGVLSLFGARPATVTSTSAQTVVQDAPRQAATSNTTRNLLITLIVVVVGVGVLFVVGSRSPSSSSTASEDTSAPASDTPIQQLVKAQPENIAPTGALADMFTLGSDNTDLQRENEMAKLKGKVVQWTLPVYDVSKNDDGYKIQTQSGANLLDSSNGSVSTFIQVTPQSDADRQYVEGLKTGSLVTVKGVISDESLRHLVLDPAIVLAGNGSTADQKGGDSSVQQPGDVNQAVNSAPPEIKALLDRQDKLNEQCRGGSGDDPRTIEACDARDKMFSELESKGWCYGSGAPNESEAQKSWQVCAPGQQEEYAAQQAKVAAEERAAIDAASTTTAPSTAASATAPAESVSAAVADSTQRDSDVAQTAAAAQSSTPNAPADDSSTKASNAPSFDCKKANSSTDTAICSDPKLSQLDVETASLYKKSMSQASPNNAQMLKNDQRQWLRNRAETCGADRDCIERQYTSRIQVLRQYDIPPSL